MGISDRRANRGSKLSATRRGRGECHICGDVANREKLVQINQYQVCDTCSVKVECSRCGDHFIGVKQFLDHGAFVCEDCEGHSGWWSIRGLITVTVAVLSIFLMWEYLGPQYVGAATFALILYLLYRYRVARTIWILTIPGIIIHELAHKKACDIMNVKVYDVRYFRFDGRPPGYVLPEHSGNFWKEFTIAAAPLLFNTLLASAVLLATMALGEQRALWVHGLGTWLAFAVAMHIFPSDIDLNIIWKEIKSNWRKDPLVTLTIPTAVLLSIHSKIRNIYVELIISISILFCTYLFGVYLGLSPIL